MHVKLCDDSSIICLCQFSSLSLKGGDGCPSSNSKVTGRSRSFTTKKGTKRNCPTDTEDLSSAVSREAKKKLCKRNSKPQDTLSLISGIAQKIKLLKQMSVCAAVDNSSLNMLLGSQSEVDRFQPSGLHTLTSFKDSVNCLPSKASRYMPFHFNQVKSAISSTNTDTTCSAVRITASVPRHLVQSTLTGSVVKEQKTQKRKTDVNIQRASNAGNTQLPIHACVDTNKEVASNAMQDYRRIEEFFQPSPMNDYLVPNANMNSGT